MSLIAGAVATVVLAIGLIIQAIITAAAQMLVAAVKFTIAVIKTSAVWMKTVGTKLVTAIKAGWSQGLINLKWGTVAKGAGLNGGWSGIQTARYGGSATDILKSAAKGAVIGAVGAVTGSFMHGMGAGAGSLASGGGSFTGTAIHAAAHGVSGGAMSAANGGSFKDGFIGGAVGFGVGLPFGGAGGMIQGSGPAAVAARTTIAAVGGGVASNLSGGSFADGAYSAAFFHLFNSELEVQWGGGVTGPVERATQAGTYSVGGDNGTVIVGPMDPIPMIAAPSRWGRFWNGFQAALDVAGMIPGIGEPFDLVNGVIHGVRGNYGQAALSFAAMVPVVGNIVSATKMMARGRAVHKGYKAGLADRVNTFKEYRDIPGIRPDFVDFNTRTIYELKPNNPRQIASGHRQLARYKTAFEQVHGSGWNVVLDTY